MAESSGKARDKIIALVADTHCGSKLGLMPPAPWNLVDGGTYFPNKMQGIVWETWEEYWQIVANKRAGKDLTIVFAGDAIEGIHHGMKELVSIITEEHVDIHLESMSYALDTVKFNEEVGDALYYVDGTGVHDGSTGSRIGKDLGARPYKENTFVWPKIRGRVNGFLFDIAHEGAKPGTRAWTKTNGLYHTLKSIYFDCLEDEVDIPDYWIRAHCHTWIEPVVYQGRRGKITGMLMPCFQAPTKYGKRFLARKSALIAADIGGLWFIQPIKGEPIWGQNILRYKVDDVITL